MYYLVTKHGRVISHHRQVERARTRALAVGGQVTPIINPRLIMSRSGRPS